MRTSRGTFVVSGRTESDFVTGPTDAFAFEIDASGNVQWQKVFGGDSRDAFWAALELQNGDLVFAGTTHGFGSPVPPDVWMVRVSGDGAMDPACTVARDVTLGVAQGYLVIRDTTATVRDTNAQLEDTSFPSGALSPGVEAICAPADPCPLGLPDRVQGLTLVRSGADISFAWTPDAKAVGGYNVYNDGAKQQIPSLRRDGGVQPVASAPTETLDLAGAVDTGALFYQVVGVCNDSETEGPN